MGKYFEFHKKKHPMNEDNSLALETWILSPFLVFREDFHDTQSRYFSVEELSKTWELMPKSMKAPYVDKAAIRMNEFENKRIAQYKKTLEDFLIEGEKSEEFVNPATGFVIFLEEFLESCQNKSVEEFVEICQNKSVSAGSVTEDLFKKWESMKEAEKAPYHAKAEERMVEYDEKLIAQCKKPEESIMEGGKSETETMGKCFETHKKKHPMNEDNSLALEDGKPDKLLSPFLVFREDFLDTQSGYFSIAEVSKRWENMAESLKAPYVDKAATRMNEYENKIIAQYKKMLEDWLFENEKSDEFLNPATGFVVFLEEFLESCHYKTVEEFVDFCQNNSVSAVSAGSVIEDLSKKWESMKEAEKAPYLAKAEKRMVEYDEKFIAHGKKVEGS